jgi:hypothetical protein
LRRPGVPLEPLGRIVTLAGGMQLLQEIPTGDRRLHHIEEVLTMSQKQLAEVVEEARS